MKRFFTVRPLVVLQLSVLFILSSAGVSAQEITRWEALVRAENQWSYLAATSEPPADWNAPEFNDTSWKKGPGGIGYGDNDDATVVSGVNTIYMRHAFQVADTSAIKALFLYMDYDDGFVAYLNGTEIARANMGTTYRPAWNAYAANCDPEAKRPSGGIPPRFILRSQHLTSLRNGTNILAIQVHNCNATSSDLSSTAFLIAGLTGTAGTYQSLPSWMTSPALESSHLPLIVIETFGSNILNEPKITVDMQVIDNGPGASNTPFTQGNVYNGSAAIEVRGQSSQNFPKKSYGFELRNTLGDEVKVPLLGMPEESDWVLYAPYSDKTLLRNAISYYTGRRMGRYQPRFRFCELYINGDYKGIYQLTERIKRDKNRVDIAKLKPEDVSNDDVTGGYIVKVDKTHDLLSTEFFNSVPDIRFPGARTYSWSWYYPKPEDLVQAQRNYFQAWIKSAENALNSENFTSPYSGYANYLDVPSFIDFQIINELANNVDGYRYSTFFHKDKDSNGGKLKAGPLWDFDLSYGNVNYVAERLATNTWLYTSYGMGEPNCMHWWYRLMQDPVYRDALRLRYSTLRRGVLHTDSVMAYIDSQIDSLGDAVTRNFNRWPILGVYIWPNSATRYSYAAEITFLKEWITRRLNWMDSQWLVPVAAPDLTAHSGVSVWPNPFHDDIHIALPAGASRVTLELLDLRGMKIRSQQFTSNGSEMVLSGNAPLPAGIYIIRISGNGFTPFTTKLIKE